MNTPVEIRRKVRQNLSDLSPHERQQLIENAISRFVRTRAFRNSKHIACYFPVRHELDIIPLIEYCWSCKKKVYLPCLSPRPFNHLYFLPFSRDTKLSLNRFRIPEPDHTLKKRVHVHKLDIVVTPLLAFDQNGARLGMGGGFYDRTFAFKRYSKHLNKPKLWSIALEIQHYSLTPMPWDVYLDGIVTESSIYHS
ncbi:MAG: 5-formyltetrahydrofolate cyclo-ligase [Gammaproteobacteria bacterium]|nr:MAG: 5-formyltetrahydrofolate cyclo-ligase [Gammaproteobacteria bacterium]